MPINIIPNPAIVKQAHSELLSKLKFIDIGVNLTDPVFRGVHHGKKKHEDDLLEMLKRSRTAGVRSMIITGGSLRESQKALDLATEHKFYSTAGCHPTRSSEFDKYSGGPEKYLEALDRVISQDRQGQQRIVAIGECGLDYDRLHFASKETQMRNFRPQLGLAKKYALPLFLHCRAAHSDFVRILKEEGFGKDGGKEVGAKGGVVHSFTGTKNEMEELMDMGFHISFNGCSMKTEEQLEVCKAIRPDRLLLETDAPWCSMRPTQASHKHLEGLEEPYQSAFFPPAAKPEAFIAGRAVKGRNEPSAIGGVAWVIHRLTGVPFDKVVNKAWKNTISLFSLDALEVDTS